MIETGEPITRKEVEKKLVISQAMAVRVLKALVDKNMIRVVGGGKNTKYISAKHENSYARKQVRK